MNKSNLEFHYGDPTSYDALSELIVNDPQPAIDRIALFETLGRMNAKRRFAELAVSASEHVVTRQESDNGTLGSGHIPPQDHRPLRGLFGPRIQPGVMRSRNTPPRSEDPFGF